MSLASILAERPEDLLITAKVRDVALRELKETLDPLAAEYSVLDAVHVDGLDADQVFVQTQMVVDGAIDKLFSVLSERVGLGAEQSEESQDDQEEEEEASDEVHDEDSEIESLAPQEQEGDSPNGTEFTGFDEAQSSESADEDEDDENDKREPAVSSEKSDGFNLEEFQQHVLALEQDPEDDEEIDYNAEDQGSSDDDLRYEDFFGSAKKRAKKANKPIAKPAPSEPEEDAFTTAMESATRDLFASEDEEEEAGEHQSKFELQQQDLEAQIARLEDENVSGKGWEQAGEALASERPINSLVNAEMTFDRNSKPVPVITAETTQTLEELIKDRIKKQEFDDLTRRIPDGDLDHKKSRELDTLSESKSQKSLAELYEEDHMRQQNPEYYANQDAKAMTEAHQEIVELYSVLSRKLDSLSSWAYTPKAPKPSLAIVTDAAAISMEEAQPSTMAADSMLAPQEIYKATAASKDEIVGANALPKSRSELTPEEKKRLRRQTKERAKKSGAEAKPKKESKKDAMFETLQKGNVTMVDKRGKKRDLHGNEIKDSRPLTAGNVKL